jgi:hypothetical protein
MAYVPDELESELNCFFISGSRHDKDRIELQFGFDGLVSDADRQFSYIVDFVLFVPQSLNMIESPELLRTDIQSYVRLHTHVSNPDSETSFPRVQERLALLKRGLDLNNLRNFAVDFQGFLKGHDKKLREQLRSLASEVQPDPARLERLTGEMRDVLHVLEDFRSILKARHIDHRSSRDLIGERLSHDLILLNEYFSHLYVQYLGDLTSTARGSEALAPVVADIHVLATAEAAEREKCGFMLDDRGGPEALQEMELYPRRIGILKKYFQSPLFVREATSSLQKRLMLPVYALSAGLAALFFIMIQTYNSKTFEQRMGFNSALVLTLAIVAYVVRDLSKDLFRAYLFKRSGRWFADEKRTLFLKKLGREFRLGKISEFLRIFDSSRLPPLLKQARYSTEGGELEEELKEDTYHFKKHVKLDLKTLDSNREFPWGFREILRLRMDRYTTHMDDAFKKVYLVSRSGALTQKQAHRVYILHLAAWVRADAVQSDGKKFAPAFRAFQITMDKNGIQSCQQMSWKKDFGIPPTP